MTTAQPVAAKTKKVTVKVVRRINRNNETGKLITRDSPINIRAYSFQRALIDRAVEVLGTDRSDFMLEAACRQAEEVLLDRRMFLLDDAAYSKFTSLLDRAPKDNPKLRALLSKKAPWDK